MRAKVPSGRALKRCRRASARHAAQSKRRQSASPRQRSSAAPASCCWDGRADVCVCVCVCVWRGGMFRARRADAGAWMGHCDATVKLW
eukprot:350365-Chlamydomonas_euryale.AAC.2